MRKVREGKERRGRRRREEEQERKGRGGRGKGKEDCRNQKGGRNTDNRQVLARRGKEKRARG